MTKDCKLILIEGVPGSGKTSLAQYVQKLLEKQGMDAEWFLEERRDHPVMPRQALAENRRSDFPERCLERWRSFVADREAGDRLAIVEGTAFQSTVRFMFAHETPHSRIAEYFAEFERVVAPLAPRFIYLATPDSECFLRDETIPRKGPDWVGKVTEYSNSTSYSTRRGLSGQEGFVDFWACYGQLCSELFEAWGLPRLRIENRGHEWKSIHRDASHWLAAQ